MSEVRSRGTDDGDIEATNELPVLSEAAIVSLEATGADAGPAASTDEQTTPVPFPKLERRRAFEQRMVSMEGRIGARDAAVDALGGRVDEIARGWESIETQLTRNAAAIELIAEELGGLRTRLDGAALEPGTGGAANAAELAEERAAHGRSERARAAAEAELETLRGRLHRRDEELAQGRDALAERETELEAARERLAALTESGDDPRAELAALTDYITNRREHWDALEARVAEQAERIRELETELQQRVARQHEAEELAARESARAAEYRADLARHVAPGPAAAPAANGAAAGDRPGALGELEDQLVELCGELDEQRERLDAAAGPPARAAAEDADAVHERLTAAEAELEQARTVMRRLEHVLLERDRMADDQSTRIAALQHQLSQHVDRLRDQRNGGEPPAAHAAAPHAAETAELGALVCLTSERPEHYTIAKPSMLIGRSTEADIRIPTHFVSREHARVRNDGQAVYIDDLGSTNGVFVNSIRVDSQELHDGDWITIGETQFRYIATPSPESAQ